jgi:hypothetical protein
VSWRRWDTGKMILLNISSPKGIWRSGTKNGELLDVTWNGEVGNTRSYIRMKMDSN